MARNGVYLLLGSVMILVAVGIIMLTSTSAFAHDSRGDMLYFLKRQIVWLAVGFVAFLVAARLDYHFWQKTWAIWFGMAVILLILCFIPPIGMKINGSWRWINLGFMSFQPSELGKLAAVFFLAWWFARLGDESGTFWKGFVLPLAVVGILCLLIVAEVDLGTTALIGAVTLSIMFVAGANSWLLSSVVIAGIAGIIGMAMTIPQRMSRLLAFMDLERYRLDEGLQQYQALIAFGSGGLEGLGLGQGRQKMLYLPYAHTDFIFPMIGEELGFRVTAIVTFCYLAICIAGCMIACNARDRFGMLLAFGTVMIISVQAAVNIAVTTALLPNKGMPLPFISYGGSNLVLCLILVGILLNVHLQGRPVVEQPRRVTRIKRRLAVRI
jgi:cell division protein FtsW